MAVAKRRLAVADCRVVHGVRNEQPSERGSARRLMRGECRVLGEGARQVVVHLQGMGSVAIERKRVIIFLGPRLLCVHIIEISCRVGELPVRVAALVHHLPRARQLHPELRPMWSAHARVRIRTEERRRLGSEVLARICRIARSCAAGINSTTSSSSADHLPTRRSGPRGVCHHNFSSTLSV